MLSGEHGLQLPRAIQELASFEGGRYRHLTRIEGFPPATPATADTAFDSMLNSSNRISLINDLEAIGRLSRW